MYGYLALLVVAALTVPIPKGAQAVEPGLGGYIERSIEFPGDDEGGKVKGGVPAAGISSFRPLESSGAESIRYGTSALGGLAISVTARSRDADDGGFDGIGADARGFPVGSAADNVGAGVFEGEVAGDAARDGTIRYIVPKLGPPSAGDFLVSGANGRCSADQRCRGSRTGRRQERGPILQPVSVRDIVSVAATTLSTVAPMSCLSDRAD